jgi:hypothetical protein
MYLITGFLLSGLGEEQAIIKNMTGKTRKHSIRKEYLEECKRL